VTDLNTNLNKTTLLLAGHGSRKTEGNAEIERFAEQWRAKHPDWRIEVCFIEHAEVLLNDGLDRATQGARRVLLIPFILNAAGHVKMELPAALEAARLRHPTSNSSSPVTSAWDAKSSPSCKASSIA